MHEVGLILSRMTAHEFSEAGFFDKELKIIPYSPSDDCLIFAKDCLQNKTVQSVLTPQTIYKINEAFAQYGHLFPGGSEKHLVHADFDPANILVHKVDGSWKVSGVLDWEFAFSGSVLCDVANMLRYAHKMPPEFQNAFLKGLGSGGVILPENWRNTINLLNLLSLLDILQRSDPKNSPNQCTGIRELIDHILSELNISIRKLRASDIAIIVDAFGRANWPKPASIFETYLQEQLTGARLVWVAYVNDQFAGYVTLNWQSQYPSFKAQNIPEIVDLNVLPAYRKIGVGSLLLDTAEKKAATRSKVVGIGVGLYAGADGGYGPAQRLYVKHGYIPDGKGVTYNYEPTIPGNSYLLDDDLVLWFTKKFR
jgi:GNAT superfamily N-acetyltransferase